MFEDKKYECLTDDKCFETLCAGCKALEERIAQAIRINAAAKQQDLRKALHTKYKPKRIKS
tara:strand:+ start:323 stop:505 length:183 start_codon:yes stop_codon:yes gene_type:complete